MYREINIQQAYSLLKQNSNDVLQAHTIFPCTYSTSIITIGCIVIIIFLNSFYRAKGDLFTPWLSQTGGVWQREALAPSVGGIIMNKACRTLTLSERCLKRDGGSMPFSDLLKVQL